MKKIRRPLIIILMIFIFAFVLDYVVCPPWNLHSGQFIICVLLVLAFSVILVFFGYLSKGAEISRKYSPTERFLKIFGIGEDKTIPTEKNAYKYPLKGIVFAALALIVIAFFGNIISAKLFHAKGYSSILNITDGDTSDIPSAEKTNAIALMDTQSAVKLGDREIGSLSSVVSQYDIVSEDYCQVNIGNKPLKVAPLSYAGFFKWNNNKDNGVPGYVSVDPVSMDADYIKLEKGMKYVPSAYFGEDLYRHIRRTYRMEMFYDPHFEVDENGNPWYVAPIYTKSIGLFGGEKVIGAILCDPVTGDMEKYSLEDVPRWVDVVVPGDLICRQYNDYAQLQKGFWNSIIGQDGCRKITESAVSGSEDSVTMQPDFGYIAKDDDIYIYTGVTSVNGDSSNIGFIIANERTGETVFLDCAGADEFSAMSAAEGEVQEKAYKASFPSLITVDGIPTYIMVLKDKSGLVKLYACVNVSQYNIVATSSKQKDCIDKYTALLKGEITEEEAISGEEAPAKEEVDTSEFEPKKITVSKIETIDKDGNTYIYVVDKDSNIYSAKYADVLGMILVSEGDEIEILTDGKTFTLPE